MRTALLALLCTVAGGAADLNVPVAAGSFTIDGTPNELPWRDARSFSFNSPKYPAAFPPGGDASIAVSGGYLCLAARLPETGRFVAISTGRNPTWLLEDQVMWTFTVNINSRNRRLTLTVNPHGAYRFDSTVPEPGFADGVMAAAQMSATEWSVEAAVPLAKLAQIGFVTVERVRAPRPNAPELHWFWPGANERMDFQLPASNASAEPVFQSSSKPAPRREARTVTGAEAELAARSGRIWSDQERASVEAAFQSSIRRRLSDAAVAERVEWEQVKTRSDWERFRDQRLSALRKSFGTFPERTPLRAAVTRRADYGRGFIVENVVYESRPGRLIPANLYLPTKISGRIPAILVVHSHHAPKTQAELQDMGMTWARSGVAVLVPDGPGAGERVESQLWPRESYYSRYALGMQLYLAGEMLMKWMVWDLMRGIDMLLERPYIDDKRIIILGAVAGGGDPAAVTAALEPRIAVSIPFNFGEAGPEEHYTQGPRPYDSDTADPGHGSWESTRNLYRSAVDQFFPWFICASVAPRRFIYSFEIGWPKSVEEEPAWARYKKVFSFYSEPENLASVNGFGPFPGPGECTNAGSFVRKRIYPVLKRWLDVPIPEHEYHGLTPDSELMCINPEIAAERKPQTTAALAASIARARLDRARKTPSMLPSMLAAKLGDIEPNRNAEAHIVTTNSVAGFSEEAVGVEVEPGITLPLIVLKPNAQNDGRRPAVLAFAQDGKSGFLANRAPEIVRILETGAAICLADVRATGELSKTAARNPGAMGAAATELMLGKTMLGARVKDARTIYAYLSRRPDIDPGRIVLWGDSFAAVNPREMFVDKSPMQAAGADVPQAEPLGPLLALITALYEPDVAAVAARRGLVSFLSVLEDRFAYIPLDVIVPGILEVGDVSDIAAALRPRPVLIQAAVDGRNRPVDETADPGWVADWIVAHLR